MAAPSSEQPRCDVHPAARAGWGCGACGRALCPDCVGDKRLRNGIATLCLPCGGLAAKLTRPRRIAPYWEMFADFLGAIFSGAGLVQLFAIGLFMYLVSWLPGVVGWVAVAFVWITYYFQVIGHAARGGTNLPEPADFLGWESIFPPLFRFFVATALIWVPGVVYLLVVVGPGALLSRGPAALLDPVLFVLIFAGLLYFPAAIIAAAVADSVLAVINPLITVRMILRIPGQYLLTWCVWAGLSVLDMLVRGGLTAASKVVEVPIFSALLVQVVSLIVPVFTGLILGRLIYQNAEEFGLLGAGDDVEELWPEATPRGEVPADTRTAALRPNVDPVAIAGWEVDAVPAPPPVAPAAAPRPSAVPAPWAPSPAAVDAEPLELDLHAPAPHTPPLGEALSADLLPPPRAPTAGPEPTALDLPPRSRLDAGEATWPEGPSAPRGDASLPPWLETAAGAPPPGAPASSPAPPTASADESPVVHDTHAWLSERGAGPGAPWSLDADATVPVDGHEWLEDVAGAATELDLGVQLATDAAEIEARAPRRSGGLLEGAQVGPSGELRPGPSGELPAGHDLEPPPAHTSPAQLAPEAPGTVTPAVPILAGSPLHDPPGAPAGADEHAARLQHALERGDVSEVLRAFVPRAPGAYPALDARLELRLAGILERESEFEEAVKACRRAVAQAPTGPFAPRALFMGGRLLAERIEDPGRARAVWEHLVRAFPHEQIAELARAGLRKLG